MDELTSANTAPNLIPFPINHSVDSPISGEYSFNKSSSSWREERTDPACVNIISRVGCADAKIPTAVLAKNRNSNSPWCFPIAMVSVLLYQKEADSSLVATDWIL